MINTKYLADSKMFELDRYYKHCQQNNVPFIKARVNPVDGNYLVQLDLITCDYKLSNDGIRKIKEVFQREQEFLESLETSKSFFKGSNVDKQFAWFDGVNSQRLDNFCQILFDLSENNPDF